MGRLHSKGKGIASSAIPYSRSAPAWLKTTPDQVVDQICKLAKKGATPSQIGVVLRDSHGVAQVKVVTGKLRQGFPEVTGREERNFDTNIKYR
jgi:small subunit ribosomal protein S13e